MSEQGIENATETPIADAIQQEVDKASGFFTSVLEYFRTILPQIIIAVIILVIGILISKLISKIASRGMKRSGVDNAARSFLVSVIKIVLYAVVMIMALTVLKVPMSSIITILGAAGLAASLALQNCLTNLCGGFIILFSKPFSAGDTVELDFTIGKVEAIGVLYTKLSTFDGKVILIPNGNVTSARLINYTETPTRRVEMKFDISYDSDYIRARHLILTAISEESIMLQEPAPIVRMGGHKDSSVTIDVMVWVKNDDFIEAGYILNETVKKVFDKSGITIPYKQLDVHLHNEKK